MSRSPDRFLGLAAAIVLVSGTLTPAAQPSEPADGTFPVEDIESAVENIRLTVESLDATESETREDGTVTVTLTSDVLFALDKAEVTAKARDRLARVAGQIRTDTAGGAVKIAGHTDDQGTDAYNRRLSQRRAEAVRGTLSGLLTGQSITFEATGHGEADPRVPNIVGNKPNAKNRALNRRVEIVYTVDQ
ncbi:OmpA family protein [Nonomuraea sp. NPDC050404]|uniref:OmpA family protein n=1 Tax=Nonomuraea sp. NPDC050404 TaxID=3155783 RepID=UPI0033F187DE